MDKLLTEVTAKTQNIKSLRDVALEFLREAIFTGHYQPGDHLKERDLSKLLGISTTPIKEALRVLSHDGLVETVPRKGTFVSELVETSIEEFMMLKSVLEGLAAKLAALKITDDEVKVLEKQVAEMEKLTKAKEVEKLVSVNFKFHRLIREAANNPMMFQTLNNVVALDIAFRKRALKYDMEIEKGFLEHNEIFQSIKTGKAELAEELMKKHIMRTAVNVLEQK
ncbi:GntR family transcriptional regulator [Alteribacillus sp. JSM 102045]|uniref:GntR family transcriptional regulator n=1 Tax=Alteribacillus sp. JSM 102045 TaxID=1562101 RepID=UPI0035C1A866